MADNYVQPQLPGMPPPLVPVTHDACGQIAFYLTHVPSVGDLMLAKDVFMPNGQHPPVASIPVCGACGRPIALFTDGKTVHGA